MSSGDTPDARRTRARTRWWAVPAAVVALGAAAGPEGAVPAGASGTEPPLAVRVTATGCSAVASQGGGVALGGTRVATVAHVVAGATAVTVTTAAGAEHTARIVAIDTARDVALLDVAGLTEPPARTAELTVGQRGTYLGWGRGRATTVPFTVKTAAEVVSEDIYVKGRHGRPGYVLTAAVVHGDSGAGLVRADGALGGLVWATSRNDDREGWGVGIDAVLPLASATPAGAPAAPAVACPP